MSEETPLYTGADRGQFRVVRLLDNAGVQLRPFARIKDAVVFNFLSDLQYAIVGYSMEWWKEDEAAPQDGGEPHPYIPRGRPAVNRLYFRTKTSHTPKMLHLEDAIINDFLNVKVLADPMSLSSYTQESEEQAASAAQWRTLLNSPFSFANAVHITRFATTPSTPLAVDSEGLRFEYRRTTNPDQVFNGMLRDYKFEKLRDCYPAMLELIESEQNGSNS
jgi:hypothetical protein